MIYDEFLIFGSKIIKLFIGKWSPFVHSMLIELTAFSLVEGPVQILSRPHNIAFSYDPFLSQSIPLFMPSPFLNSQKHLFSTINKQTEKFQIYIVLVQVKFSLSRYLCKIVISLETYNYQLLFHQVVCSNELPKHDLELLFQIL